VPGSTIDQLARSAAGKAPFLRGPDQPGNWCPATPPTFWRRKGGSAIAETMTTPRER